MDLVSIDGLPLRIDRQTMMSPVICPDTPETKVLNWVTEFIGTLAERLERRVGAYAPPQFAAEPIEAGEITAADRDRWRALTGGELGDDVYRLSAFDLPPLVIPRATLRAIVALLEKLRREAKPPPGPWLFAKQPLLPHVSPEEEGWMRDLEARAVELDALDAPPRTLERTAGAAAKRRFLLGDLEAHGIFTDDHSDAMLAALEHWKLPVLIAYKNAALRLTEYFKSAPRQRHLPDEDRNQRILGARISVDWFRRPQPLPAGTEPFDWLAFCERTMISAGDLDGQEGEIFVRVNQAWGALHWRRDDAVHPAIWRVGLG